jgi:uncharacterized protein YqgV (UPF0045/DUF77 family)
MIGISVQVSLYPLGHGDLVPAIEALLAALDAHGLPYDIGPMSTTLWGDDETVWAALQEGFRAAAALGGAVMQVTVSNACPLPPRGGGHG